MKAQTNHPVRLRSTLILVLSVFLLLSLSSFSHADQLAESPEINYIYFSPFASEGVKDSLIFELQGIGEDSWSAYIYNTAGKTVWEQNWKGAPNKFIEWKGVDSEGRSLPDGVYTYHIIGQDEAGNSVNQKLPGLVIDNTSPEIKVKSDILYISPVSSPGIQDHLILLHTGKGQDSYFGEVIDENGDVIWTTQWQVNPNREILWKAVNLEGKVVPDGKYTYRVVAKDKAGNSDEMILPGIVVDNTVPELELSQDLVYFSPNGDNVNDVVTFTTVGNGADIWELTIRNMKGDNVLYQKYLDGKLPPIFKWKGTNQNNEVLPDGQYSLTIKGQDKAGNFVEQTREKIIIDNTPPEVEVNVRTSYFSPDGNGILDEMVFLPVPKEFQSGDKAYAVIKGEDNLVIHQWEFATLPEQIAWNGRDENNKLMPDGFYQFELMTFDSAGNRNKTQVTDIEKITRENSAQIQLSRLYFSPKKKI